MAYFVTLEPDGSTIDELFFDGYLPPPVGATQIADADGEILSRQSRFGEWELGGGSIRRKAL